MLKYILPIVLLGFTACELTEDDILKSIAGEAEEVPAGTYISQCMENASDSSGEKFTLVMSDGSYTIQETSYASLADCVSDTGGSDQAVSASISADLPGPDLGEGFSFYTDSDGKKVPYFYEDGRFVVGEAQDALPNGEDDFSGFKDDLEANRIAIYDLQQ